MTKSSLVLIVAVIILWGLWGFLGKLGVQKIGLQVSFWSSLTLALSIITYLFFSHQLLPLKNDTGGIALALLAGISSALASILFYILLEKKPAGFLVTVTALYPLVTLLLSVLLLKESLTAIKIVGFVLAIAALFFLNL